MYNTLLLNYNITIITGIEDRGMYTPVEIRKKIIRKLRETFNFTQAIITYV